MNLENLSADIAARIPEMSRDSAINNAQTIKGIIKQYQPKEEPIVIRATHDRPDKAWPLAITAMGCLFFFGVLMLALIDLKLNQPQQPKSSDNFFIKGWDAAMQAKLGSNRQYVTNIFTVTNYVHQSKDAR